MTSQMTPMHCGPDGCTGNCRSGRDCLDSLAATRRILGLRTDNDGHRISGEDSVRIDPPAYSPEEVEGWTLPALFVIGVIAVALFGAAVKAFYF